jgi:hypothetical protein
MVGQRNPKSKCNIGGNEMDLIIIAVDRYNKGCAGRKYGSIKESIIDGGYQVWTYNRMRSFNRVVDDPVKHFKEHMRTNKCIALSPERFFNIISKLPVDERESHLNFYNESIEKW